MKNEQGFLDQTLDFCIYCGSKRVAVCPDTESLKYFIRCYECNRESVRENDIRQAVFSWLEGRLIEKVEQENDRA